MICSYRPSLRVLVRKIVVRRATAVAVEIVNRTVCSVRSALDRHVDRGSRRVSLLSIKRVRLDLELLHRIRRRRKTHRKIESVVRRTVKRDLILGRCSIRPKCCEIAIRDKRGELRIARVDHSRRQRRQLVSCPFSQRTLPDLLSLYPCAGTHAASLNRLARDYYH